MFRFFSFHNLRTLLGNISEELFFKDYWQIQPLLVRRNDLSFYAGLLSISDIDIIISMMSATENCSDIRLVRSTKEDFLAEVIPKTRNGLIDITMIYQKYADGFTLAMHKLERRWLPLTSLATELYNALGAEVTVGLYLTPPESQGLAPHFDSYEIFIMQISGKKKWNLYESPNKVYEGPMLTPTSAAKVIELLPGDLLYLPRYMGHEAISQSNESLHLTIAVNVTQVVDLIITALKEVSKTHYSLRKAIPLNQKSTTSAFELKTAFLCINEERIFERAIETIIFNQLETINIVPDGHFYSLSRVRMISSSSIVKKRTSLIYVEECDNQICVIRFPGNTILSPSICLPAINYIIQNTCFSINSLPGSLSDDAKLVLVRKLIIGGLISIVEL